MWCSSSASLGSSVAQRPPLGWAQGYGSLATPGFTQLRSSPCQRPAPPRRKSRWVPPTKVRHGSGAARGLHANVDVDVSQRASRGQVVIICVLGCRGHAPAHGRADRRCQLSARFGTLVAFDTTPMRRPETARQSRSRRRVQGPRTSGLHSQGLPGCASSVVQKVKLARGYGGDDPIS